MVAYLEANRLHLEDHGPSWTADQLSISYWERQLAVNIEEFEKDQSAKFFMFENGEPATIIGTINFSAILRRAAQFCYLGYGLAQNQQGKGLMHDGLKVAIDYVFYEMNLHRIMANYVPTNERSGNVLKKLGFQVEGYARD